MQDARRLWLSLTTFRVADGPASVVNFNHLDLALVILLGDDGCVLVVESQAFLLDQAGAVAGRVGRRIDAGLGAVAANQ